MDTRRSIFFGAAGHTRLLLVISSRYACCSLQKKDALTACKRPRGYHAVLLLAPHASSTTGLGASARRALVSVLPLALSILACGESKVVENSSGVAGMTGLVGGGSGGGGHDGVAAAGSSFNDCFGLAACPDGQIHDPETCDCRACATVDECPDGLTCDLEEGKCREALPCASHADCGRSLACGIEGVCTPNGPGGPCARESNCPVSDHCALNFCGCTVTRYTVATLAPDVLLVLDRSESMNELVDGVSKWDIARQAIGALVDTHVYGTARDSLKTKQVTEASLVCTCSFEPR
jgi:hypothetical protein